MSYLNEYIGKNVMIVGKVIQLRGDTATLDSEGQVQIQLNRESHLSAGHGALVIGKVQPDMSIKVLTAQDLGTGDYQAVYRATVEATHSLKHLFMNEAGGGGMMMH